MNQPQTQQSRPAPFVFSAGCGTLRSKPTKDAVMYFGSLTLPRHGACYLRGHRAKGEREIKLEVQSAKSRTIVATLVMPSGTMAERDGSVKVKGERKAFVLKAVLRTGESGPYLALRLPDVKIVPGTFE